MRSPRSPSLRARQILALVALSMGVSGVACLTDWKLDERKFPCRSEADCVEEFDCHPTRFVCVPAGSIVLTPDAGTSTVTLDAGTATITLDAGAVDAE